METKEGTDFIRKIISEDINTGKHKTIHTRFPPEPNGYLHIGHATAFNLSFSVAEEFGGLCNLRFDDTDPEKEEIEYVDSIIGDIQWLGYDWGERLLFASDYFEKLYEFAVALIKAGKAYVCDLSAEEFRENYLGNLTEVGKNSPFRDRSPDENLKLFEGMKNGKFEDGSKALRAKIDMTSPNVLLRDPVMYRIKRVPHYRRKDDWILYPSYDWTHGQSDAIEGITHSLCSLEFLPHRPLYDWFIDELLKTGSLTHKPRQIEFSRFNLTYCVMSKRRLLMLVNEKHVKSWDDPRMPTISGLRRRGYSPKSIRKFLNIVGISKREKMIDIGLLESIIREELDQTTPRVMGVLNPLKVVITNYPKGRVEELEVPNHPKDESFGSRIVKFSRELYIEKDDFMEEPFKKFRRLAPGREVRFRFAYLITCTDVIKDKKTGEILEVHCIYDPETKGGSAPDGRKVKGTIHWVSVEHALPAEVRLYDRLFHKEKPMEEEDFRSTINPDSLTVITAQVEDSLKNAESGSKFQFERLGYFCVDNVDSSSEKLVFNRTVTLRDTWARKKK